MKRILFISIMIVLSFQVKTYAQSQKTEVKYPDWARKAVIYEVNVRQHTLASTFKALEQDLPRLQKLGVDILWLMPVNPIGEKFRKGKLGSYYAVRNYMEINPEFGTKEDFKRLVNKAHELKLKVIIDWVANHTSWDNVWMEQHPDWYQKDSDGKFVSPYDWTDVVSLNYKNQDMRKAMIAAMKYWVDEFGLDGFRCDVAGLVPRDFWEEARVGLETGKKLFMLAEEEENVGMCEKAFDMFYGWRLHHLMNKVAKGEMKADTLIKYQMNFDKTFLPSNIAMKMNFVTNHDENSWNGTVKEKFGDGAKGFAVLTYTLPGMPLMYTGQEMGIEKRLKFFEKDTLVPKDKKLFAFYQSLNQLKHEQQALWTYPGGKFVPVYNNQSARVISFLRILEHQKVMVLFNASASTVNVVLQSNLYAGNYQEYFTKEKVSFKGDDPMVIPAWGFKVFVQE